MAALPTGTVTFLFTDIEGSTRLLQQLGDRYAADLDVHAAIMRRAIADVGGAEVSTAGDSFFVAFESPLAGVAAAVAAQRSLAAHDWAPGSPLRVRMGLHTGEGVPRGNDYVGIDVHRAARIANAAHGGQVILSDATRALVEQRLPEGVSIRDLGLHVLKDLAHPEHLHDLVIDGLDPPLLAPRSLSARSGNLPAELTSFVGRDDEIAEVERLLVGTRLLTLTGAGGTGKTRLALRIAEDSLTAHRDGAFFVDLSSVTDAALVPSAVARSLGIAEVAGRPVLDVVEDHLRNRELLLVLDNFEQVAEASPMIERFLTEAPGLKVLVTSRVVLSLRGEQEYMVPPLEPPDPQRFTDLDSLNRYDAVRLFAERAAAVSPGFRVTESNAPAVAEITARLDGLPLAIELAATRTKVLTPEQMLPRLQRSLTLLTSQGRTVPERQRTLRGAIAWSYALLERSQRRFFARLSVFIGGWTLESVDAVCRPEEVGLDALDGLMALVDSSLVRRTGAPDGRARFSMLETIREFATEQLQEEADVAAITRRHGEHFLALMTEAEPHLIADDQRTWLDRFEEESPNMRAALRWAIDAGEAALAQGSAGATWRFWQQRGHLAEGHAWFDEVLAMPSGQGPTAPRAKALLGAGGIAWWQQDREASGRFYREALAIERELGDPDRIAEALYNLSFVVAGEDTDSATRILDESLTLFRDSGNEQGVAQVLTMLVIRDAEAGDWERVAAGLEEVVAIWRRVGDHLHLAFDLVWLAFAYGRMERGSVARSTALEALELFRVVDNATGMGIAFTDLAFLATWEGRHRDAIRLAAASESLRRRVGGPPGGFAGILDGDARAEAGAHLSEAEADRAWEEGLAMSVDEAVAVARDEDPATSEPPSVGSR